VNYSSVSKSIYALTSDPKRSFGWPEALVTEIAEVPLRLGEEIVESVDVKVELSRAVLMAQSVVYSASFTVGQEEGRDWCCEIKDIRISCIIGLHKHERQAKQRLEVDVKVSGYKEEKWDHRAFTDQVVEVCLLLDNGWHWLIEEQYLQSSSSGTLEALADNLAGHLLSTSVELRGEVKLRVTIRKPSALPFATPSITIERTLTDYTSRRAVIVPSESTPHDQTTSRSPRPSVSLCAVPAKGVRAILTVPRRVQSTETHSLHPLNPPQRSHKHQYQAVQQPSESS